MIKIIPYKNAHQNGIDAMMQDIDMEFKDSIFPKPTHEILIIPDAYWVAIINTKIIGTVAVINIENNFAILKNMMLKKEYRGKTQGISQSLLETVINWCEVKHIPEIYLGTMTQFKAAQSFYINNGFVKISEDKLPSNFLNNPLDTVFFVKNITTFM
ncbi:GNAT family N-acetyltransferase [Psychroserpens luteus]|uniref:GNAT family N-acetyltransferase n=1 Tax=Psychroserpens luteus TaxID=1434066 RepID=A0ABW5ZV67_9FLAO|nr:GNAT family N-acetyltransferase [Psychroserpens luteus]